MSAGFLAMVTALLNASVIQGVCRTAQDTQDLLPGLEDALRTIPLPMSLY